MVRGQKLNWRPEMVSALGKEVLRHTLTADISRFHFSTASLSPGVYHYAVLEGEALFGEASSSSYIDLMNRQRRTCIQWLARAAFLFSVFVQAIAAQTQGVNNRWMGGYNSEDSLPWGGCDLEFSSGSAIVTYIPRAIDFYRSNTNISDQAGALKFSSNGAYLANQTGDTMLNGSGLNPSVYTSLYPDGLNISQSVLALPTPWASDMYILLHGTVDDQVAQAAYNVYRTTIDMNLVGGLGSVVERNQVVLMDTFNVGKLAAVRHANGRDWWIFAHRINTDVYVRFLVTPYGVSFSGSQAIGIVRPPDVGQVAFSPDGARFAYYWGEDDLDIFSFDRCSGEFYNPVHIGITDTDAMGGVAFSPNSQYLYVSSTLDVYQYDVSAPDIEATMVHIAEWDSFFSPSPPFATIFDIAQLAPDGKVYIGTGNGTDKLHVIDQPDEPGLACGMIQHGITLPTFFVNSLPNHPNYHLGPVDGSICDSLGINAGLPERGPPLPVSAFPNPSQGAFTVSYPAVGEAGLLEVRDLSGKLVRRERLPAWSTIHAMSLALEANGLYHCTVRWGVHSGTVRILIDR